MDLSVPKAVNYHSSAKNPRARQRNPTIGLLRALLDLEEIDFEEIGAGLVLHTLCRVCL